MIECLAGIPFAGSHVVTLETAIGQHTVTDVSANGGPIPLTGNVPIFGQADAHFGHGTGIDAECLRATAQGVVAESHRMLLGSDGEAQQPIVNIGITLLHHGLTGIVIRNDHIKAIADFPFWLYR